MRPYLAFLSIVACFAAGCGSPDGGNSAEGSQAITNGEVDPGHPAVVAVTFIFPKSNGKLGAVSCTGTIFRVDGDTGYVLTAAHCLQPAPADGVPQPEPALMNVIEGPDFGCFINDQSGSSCASPVHSVLAIADDPGFAVGANPPLAGHDLGVVTIDGCGPSTPTLPILPTDSMLPGTSVDIVGFGETSYGVPPLTNMAKRHVLNTLVPEFDSPTTVGIYHNPGGTCGGDSGGPWIANFQGTDYIGAVTSVGHRCSMSSIAARVSAGLDNFLGPYLLTGLGGAGGSVGGAGGTGGTGIGGSSGSSGSPAAGGTGGGSAGTNPATTQRGGTGESGGCAISRVSERGLGTFALALVGVSLIRRRIFGRSRFRAQQR